jgi:hypothetical protein
MSWVSIREFTEKSGLSTSTIRRQIQEGRLYARKFGRNWYIQAPEASEFSLAEMPDSASLPEKASFQGLIEFSSKALHHYLILSDRLMAEKEGRLKERVRQLEEKDQEVAELEGYVRLLERELRKRDEPSGGG